jgi:hypothetical protein
MTRLTLLCALFAVASHAERVQAGDGADLTAYIESIRASGMSEMGKSMISSVAYIASGATILSYRKDPESGQYWGSYMSATCPNPTADPPELTRWKQTKTDESASLVEKLKPFADADGSGFVTTKEGSDFRFLLEFGYLADQAIRDEGSQIETVARAAGLDVAATEARVREYTAIAKRISDAGVTGLPEISIPGLANN